MIAASVPKRLSNMEVEDIGPLVGMILEYSGEDVSDEEIRQQMRGLKILS